MKPIDPKILTEQLKWRYATKAFDPVRKIPADTWSALEEALVLTPSSFGLQPWKFFVVTDSKIKEKLVAASWGQKQPLDCSHHVVFTIKKATGSADVEKYIQRIVELRGGTPEALEGFKKVMLGFLARPADKFDVNAWAALQVYIALGNFMTSAALLGIDTCPMEGIVTSQYDEVLGISGKGYTTFVACAAGYRAESDKYATAPKVRFKLEDIIERL